MWAGHAWTDEADREGVGESSRRAVARRDIIGVQRKLFEL